jgi:DNA replication protein DnaC
MAERAKSMGTMNSSDLSSRYDCPKCRDEGYIVDGWKARECECLAQKKLIRRMNSAMIPDEFKDAQLTSYKIENETQKLMYDTIVSYLKQFDDIRTQTENSLGFMAKFGEQRLKEIKDSKERAEAKNKHNNFGLGKTHLQIAAAKRLIKRGYTVLIVSDAIFMDELSQKRTYDDGEAFNSLVGKAINADVLVWDDLGKAKPSEFRLSMYYRIIDERYRAKRPIMFSSNEDASTLSERIGDATASRLFSMAKNFLLAVEGPDYRLRGA